MAMVLLLFLSPMMLIIALLLFATQRKVFFVQTRPGYLEQPFKIYKFITMKAENGKTDKERITPFGSFLRKLSLDELPQLINIIKGDMSFIGPRPFLVEYLPLYSDYHKKRHWVMPGITGLAQVTGKNNVAWSTKLDLDTYYSENISFLLDIKIIALTITYFLKGCPGSYPATKFKGYQ